MRCRAALLLAAVFLLGGCATTTPISTPENRQAAQINLQLGLEYLQRGRVSLAEEKLKKSLALDDGIPQTHNALAVIYTDRGDFEQAEKHYQRALSLDRGYQLARLNYADMLCRASRYAEGIAEYTRVADETEGAQRLRAVQGRGLCRIVSADLDSAESDLRLVLEADRFAPQALLGMAQIYFQRGDTPSALGYLQRREATAPVSAASLWLGYQIEGALNNSAAQESYGVRLRTEFPGSEEASQLRRLLR
jgi:type IV pilus assembly protein PilF